MGTNAKTQKYFWWLIFGLIIGLGIFVRVYKLGSIPTGFFCDEASIGYNAYSILKTGTDEYNVSYPVFFRAFGEYKNPIQTYSTVPFIAILGLNEVAVRLPSVLYGIFGMLAIFLLTKELFKQYKQSKWFALLAMFFLAVSPWHIHFSRVSLEGLMPFVFFTTMALFLFLKAQEKPILLLFSALIFTAALYSYFPARIFIPILGHIILILYWKFFWTNWRLTLISAGLLVLLSLPMIQNILSTDGLARWQQVNIFANPPINETVWQHIAVNYLRHFSSDFLFFKGDIGMPGQFITRHSVRGIGELYLFQLPLIILGLVDLIKKGSKNFFLILLWFLLYPVGSMFTIDASPQATRSIIGVVPLQILAAGGIIWLLKFNNKKTYRFSIIVATLIIALVSFSYYLRLYFVNYPLYSADYWGWQYGASPIVKYFSQMENQYDDLIMAPEFNAPEIFFKFYTAGGCAKCKIGLPSDFYKSGKKQLFAITPAYLKNNAQFKYQILKSIYYPDGKIAFLLTKINP